MFLEFIFSLLLNESMMFDESFWFFRGHRKERGKCYLERRKESV